MRLVGVLLIGFGATIAWYLGAKGEDLSTLRSQIFAFFKIPDPGSVLPAGQPATLNSIGPQASAGGAVAAALAQAGQSISAGAQALASGVSGTPKPQPIPRGAR